MRLGAGGGGSPQQPVSLFPGEQGERQRPGEANEGIHAEPQKNAKKARPEERSRGEAVGDAASHQGEVKFPEGFQGGPYGFIAGKRVCPSPSGEVRARVRVTAGGSANGGGEVTRF